MKTNSLKSIAFALGCAVVLGACGGSTDNEAGAPAPMQVVPTDTDVGSGGATCGPIPGNIVQVFVYGGTAPYRIESTLPTAIGISTNVVPNHGGSFGVQLLGGCLVDGTVTVVDSLNTVVVYTISYEPADA